MKQSFCNRFGTVRSYGEVLFGKVRMKDLTSPTKAFKSCNQLLYCRSSDKLMCHKWSGQARSEMITTDFVRRPIIARKQQTVQASLPRTLTMRPATIQQTSSWELSKSCHSRLSSSTSLTKFLPSHLLSTAKMNSLNFDKNSHNYIQEWALPRSHRRSVRILMSKSTNNHMFIIKSTISRVLSTKSKTIELSMCERSSTCRSRISGRRCRSI